MSSLGHHSFWEQPHLQVLAWVADAAKNIVAEANTNGCH